MGVSYHIKNNKLTNFNTKITAENSVSPLSVSHSYTSLSFLSFSYKSNKLTICICMMYDTLVNIILCLVANVACVSRLSLPFSLTFICKTSI